MPQLIVGSVPRGEDYFGRADLIESLWSKLQHTNILLEAPRRFGKTGAMYRLLDDPRHPFQPLYVDVEHIVSAADFMVELIAALLRERRFPRLLHSLRKEGRGLGRFLRDLPTRVDLGGIKVDLRERTDVAQHWASYGEQVIKLLAAEESVSPLLLIDEFAVMVSNIADQNRDELARFLRWFRSARLAPDTRTRFVLGGSINLLSTLDSLGLVDTVNDVWVERLKPFDPATAQRFIESILAGRGVKWLPEVKECLLEMLGAPIPYLLAVFLTAVLDRQKATGQDIDCRMVEEAFQQDLLGGATSAVFRHYRSRINDYYPGLEGRGAKAILGILSRSERPVQRETLYQVYLQIGSLQDGHQPQEGFSQLMDKLENDFYVASVRQSYAFFSKVLRLWWETHYGFQGE